MEPQARCCRIVNRLGLHIRAAEKLVRLAKRYQASIEVAIVGQSAVNAKSILAMLTLGAKNGAELSITAKGEDAEQALEAIATLVETGFGEL